MAVSHHASITASGSGVSSISVSVAVANNPNRALIATTAIADDSTAPNVTAVAFNGSEAFGQIWTANIGSGAPSLNDLRAYMHGLKAPSVTTANVVATFSGNATFAYLAVSQFYNVDQTTPWGTGRSSTLGFGDGPQAWIGTECNPGGVALGACFVNTSSPTITITDGFPEYVAAGSLSSSSGATSRTPAAPSDALYGDLELASCASANNANHTWSGSGWTKLGQQNSGANWTVSWAWRLNTGLNVDPTVSWSGSAACSARRFRFRDAAVSGPLLLGSVGFGTGATHSSTGAATSGAESRAVYLDHAAANTALAQPSGWTENNDAGAATPACRTAIGGKDVASGGTSSGNISVTGAAAAWVQRQFELLAAATQTSRVNMNATLSGISLRVDSEEGAALNSFGWSAAGTMYGAIVGGVGLNPSSAAPRAQALIFG